MMLSSHSRYIVETFISPSAERQPYRAHLSSFDSSDLYIGYGATPREAIDDAFNQIGKKHEH